jgi:hypothetical protein
MGEERGEHRMTDELSNDVRSTLAAWKADSDRGRIMKIMGHVMILV